jgi:amidase
VKYDVVGKTIAKLRADMMSGVTTSEEVTQAYLDRIEVYDKGQFGFHAYEIVASNAIEQARAADAARRRGAKGALLGIPIAVKNLFDTFDMATTNGSRRLFAMYFATVVWPTSMPSLRCRLPRDPV